MSKFKLLVFAAVLGIAGLAPLSVSATPIINLGLVIDSSGSIGSGNFNSIRTAYANVLAGLPIDGSIAITVDNFSSNGQHQVFANTIIASSGNLTSLITFVSNMTFFGGTTALSDGVADTADRIAASAFGATKNVIDVSTDGFENDSTRFLNNVAGASAYALSKGINQVNCLGIGSPTDCGNVQAGTGSFSITGVSIPQYQQVLSDKIKKETTIAPEPDSIALMGLGLAGLAFARRRKTTV